MTYGQRPVVVVLSCNQERVEETKVEVLDIEEDFQGRDLLTFRCPDCRQEHKSYRLG